MAWRGPRARSVLSSDVPPSVASALPTWSAAPDLADGSLLGPQIVPQPVPAIFDLGNVVVGE